MSTGKEIMLEAAVYDRDESTGVLTPKGERARIRVSSAKRMALHIETPDGQRADQLVDQIAFPGLKAQGAVRVGSNGDLADGELIVIGDKTFEWDSNAAVGAGNVLVTIGANEAASIVNLIAAINLNKPSVPVTAVVDPVDDKVARIYADAIGAAGKIAFTTTMAHASNVIAAVSNKLAYGEDAGLVSIVRGRYAVTAVDVSATNLMIETGITPLFVQAEYRKSTGDLIACTDKLTISGTKLKVTKAGATNLAATDVIDWIAWG